MWILAFSLFTSTIFSSPKVVETRSGIDFTSTTNDWNSAVTTNKVNTDISATHPYFEGSLESTTINWKQTSPISNKLLDEIFNNQDETKSIIVNTRAKEGDAFRVERTQNGSLVIVYNNIRITPPKNYLNNKKNDSFTPPPPPVRDIIFPDDYTSFSLGRGKPKCAEDGKSFCTVVDNYPAQHVETVLQTESKKYEELFGDDLVSNPINLTQRIDAPGEESLCTSGERLIYPQAGMTKDNNWSFIINQQNYTQGIRIEECLTAGQPCLMTDSFPIGYTTECKQKYIYRQLLAVNTEGHVAKDLFRLPSCCKCIIKSGHRFRRQSPMRRKNENNLNNYN